MSKYCFNLKINSHSTNKCRCKWIVCIAKELEEKNNPYFDSKKKARSKSMTYKWCFSYRWISDNQKFKHIIKILISCIFSCTSSTVLCHLKIISNSFVIVNLIKFDEKKKKKNSRPIDQAHWLNDDCCRRWRRYLCTTFFFFFFFSRSSSFFSLPSFSLAVVLTA